MERFTIVPRDNATMCIKCTLIQLDNCQYITRLMPVRKYFMHQLFGILFIDFCERCVILLIAHLRTLRFIVFSPACIDSISAIFFLSSMRVVCTGQSPL